jgi:C4-dicarboxylate-specific signal transduction histidine kinase
LVAIGTLSAAVAHEVKNPLAAALLSVKLLEDEVEALASAGSQAGRTAIAGDIHGLLSDVRTALERVAVIANDLQGFARKDEGEVLLVDVVVPLEAALALVAPTALKGVPISRRYEPAPRVRASARRLEQVFLNLLLNAADAMETTPADAVAIELVVGATPEGEARIEISDRGSGLAEALEGESFQPFITTKPLGKGTGLGLFVCVGILRELGGSLSLQPRDGGGAAALVVIPGDEPDALPDDERAEVSAGRPPREREAASP